MLRQREKISVAKEKRAAKTIAVIIFVFTFCWLPFFCAYVILPFCDTCTLHPRVQFRQAFKNILCPKSVLEQRRRRYSAQP
ncbi:hypothetical protein DICVIV_09226 [Dictyocaulus viviparus]|uniref:G-protein coupled receptors family 1 profile domain-containing protein n=1 Tax=Dictyocaulus viviparus TaxID=29172 RepID=A0A0D8XJE4_DICVI|nr:hypothetical protein DICVIV_09226 [Dictyocaulus viviparus]